MKYTYFIIADLITPISKKKMKRSKIINPPYRIPKKVLNTISALQKNRLLELKAQKYKIEYKQGKIMVNAKRTIKKNN